MDNIQRLEQWFAAHSADWQNDYGVAIISTDNPGWSVTIDLKSSLLATKQFIPVRNGVVVAKEKSKVPEAYTITQLKDGTLYATRDGDWIDCSVKESRFEGAGDAAKLNKIISTFLDWAS